MKRMIYMLFVLLIFISVVGCDDQMTTLKMVTGKPGGTYYPVGSGIAEIISDNSTMINVNSFTSQTDVCNAELIGDGSYDLALVQNNVAYWAKEGIGKYRKKKVSNMLAIAALYPEAIQIVVNENSGIEAVGDLKGKKVSIGEQSSGSYVDAIAILSNYKIKLEDIIPYYFSFDEAISKLETHEVDAVFITSGVPTNSILKTTQRFPLKILSIDRNNRMYIKALNSYYQSYTIPSNTYPTIKYEVKTLSPTALFVCHNSLSDSLVYELTKTFWENRNQLIRTNENIESITLASALEGISIDLHPGAKRYYIEKGILKEEVVE